MSCGMQPFYFSVAQIYDFTAVQNTRRRSLKHLVLAYVKVFGQIATVDNHITDGLNRKRKLAVEPICLGFMRIEIGRKVFMSAYVIPMYMSCDGGNVFTRQFANFVVNIANAESRIDQKATLATDRKSVV